MAVSAWARLSPPTAAREGCRLDAGVGLGLALAMALTAHRLNGGIPASAYEIGSDGWFEGDLGRVLLAMTDGQGGDATHRSEVHPLFILLTNPPVSVLRWLGWAQLPAARIAVAVMAGLWITTLYAVLRLVGLRRLDGVVLAALGASSAAAAFWLTVPETYALGSLTIMLPLGLVALRTHRSVPDWASVAASAASLSVTTTNWVAGLAAAAVTKRARRAIAVSAIALTAVVAAWGVQNLVYPDVSFFIGNVEQSSDQFFSKRAEGPAAILKVSLLFSQVLPSIRATHKGRLTVQREALGGYAATGVVAAAGWTLLLALGTWALLRAPVPRACRLALTLTLTGQVAIVLAYGSETFLYALNFTVLLIVIAGLAATTRLRPLVLIVATVVALCGAVNNYGLREQALTTLRARSAATGSSSVTPDPPSPRRRAGRIAAAQPPP